MHSVENCWNSNYAFFDWTITKTICLKCIVSNEEMLWDHVHALLLLKLCLAGCRLYWRFLTRISFCSGCWMAVIPTFYLLLRVIILSLTREFMSLISFGKFSIVFSSNIICHFHKSFLFLLNVCQTSFTLLLCLSGFSSLTFPTFLSFCTTRWVIVSHRFCCSLQLWLISFSPIHWDLNFSGYF